jgi:preprotein translocase subunit YajC
LGGTVTKVGEAFLTVRISEGVEVNVQSQAIAALLPNGTLKAL